VTLLVTVAHGTRTATGNEVARELTGLAAARLGLPGVAAYVELAEPLLSDVAASAGGRGEAGVVVPLLLSTGMHVRSDLPAMVSGSSLRLGRQLGPHPLLASAMVARLLSAAVVPGSPVVMVAAGYFDRRLRETCLDAGASVVADVIGPHPLVVDLVVSRASALVGARSFNC
jgi:sirohydrochlorin ferrochelatase